MSTGLVAAAMVARDGRYSVRVLIPYREHRVREAAEAAEQAGVDVAVAVHDTRAGATVHFMARHQDRRVPRSGDSTQIRQQPITDARLLR